jgi:hypothetical protein
LIFKLSAGFKPSIADCPIASWIASAKKIKEKRFSYMAKLSFTPWLLIQAEYFLAFYCVLLM